MRPTKLCIIADSIDTQYAGVLTYASMLLPALEATKPAEVEITYLHQRPNGFFAGSRDIVVPNPRRFLGSDTVRRMLKIPAILRSEGFDIVHDLGHMAPFPFKRESYAKVLTIHDLTPLTMPQMHVQTSRIMHRHLFPRIVANADHIITVSNTTRTDVLRELQPTCPVTAVPLAAKQLDYTGPRPHDRPYILCVGTLEPRKNIAMLLEAFEALKDAGLPHDLVLLGKEGWQIEPLLQRLAASPWAAHVIRPGFVPDEQLGAWYAHAAVAVYPSLYEGFGLPILEAMAAGVPVVLTDIPTSREVAGVVARFVPLGAPDALAAALKEVLTDADKAAALGEAGRQRASHFSWESTARQTWNVYLQHLAR